MDDVKILYNSSTLRKKSRLFRGELKIGTCTCNMSGIWTMYLSASDSPDWWFGAHQRCLTSRIQVSSKILVTPTYHGLISSKQKSYIFLSLHCFHYFDFLKVKDCLLCKKFNKNIWTIWRLTHLIYLYKSLSLLSFSKVFLIRTY